ncbi:MAG: class I SAM-dependent methyltransferase, partial [Candidatus Aenigmarchaeota archaeon]|nr:class I SAM-dependent methyltransferase [Candidatus Aenigmarchaeota archaeon]
MPPDWVKDNWNNLYIILRALEIFPEFLGYPRRHVLIKAFYVLINPERLSNSEINLPVLVKDLEYFDRGQVEGQKILEELSERAQVAYLNVEPDRSYALKLLRSPKVAATLRKYENHSNVWIHAVAEWGLSLLPTTIRQLEEYKESSAKKEKIRKKRQAAAQKHKRLRQQQYATLRKNLKQSMDQMIRQYQKALGGDLGDIRSAIGEETGIGSISYGMSPNLSIQQVQVQGLFQLQLEDLSFDNLMIVDEKLTLKYADQFMRALNFLVPHEVSHVLVDKRHGELFEVVAPSLGHIALIPLGTTESMGKEVIVDRAGYELATQVYVHPTQTKEQLNVDEQVVLAHLALSEIFIDYSKAHRSRHLRKLILPNLARFEAQFQEYAESKKIGDEVKQKVKAQIEHVHEFAQTRIQKDQTKIAKHYEEVVEVFRNIYRNTNVQFNPRRAEVRNQKGDVLAREEIQFTNSNQEIGTPPGITEQVWFGAFSLAVAKKLSLDIYLGKEGKIVPFSRLRVGDTVVLVIFGPTEQRQHAEKVIGELKRVLTGVFSDYGDAYIYQSDYQSEQPTWLDRLADEHRAEPAPPDNRSELRRAAASPKPEGRRRAEVRSESERASRLFEEQRSRLEEFIRKTDSSSGTTDMEGFSDQFLPLIKFEITDLEGDLPHAERADVIVFNRRALPNLNEDELKELFWEAFGPWYELRLIRYIDKVVRDQKEYLKERLHHWLDEKLQEKHTYYFNVSDVDSVYDFAGKSVLDVGSGPGIDSAIIAKHGAARVVGIDGSDEELARAREYAKGKP